MPNFPIKENNICNPANPVFSSKLWSANNPANIEAVPPINWHKDRTGRLPQQSITRIAKIYPGISIKEMRRRLEWGLPESDVEAYDSPEERKILQHKFW